MLYKIPEAYQDLGRSLPPGLQLPDRHGAVRLEALVAVS